MSYENKNNDYKPILGISKAKSWNKELNLNKLYYIRKPELLKITGLSNSTIWRMEKIGQFPKRRKISKILVGWLSTEIEQWLQSRELAK